MSLLNCLYAAIPAREREITCEEVFEFPQEAAYRTLAHVLEGALRAGSVVLDELPTVLRACLTIASPRSGVAESLLQAIKDHYGRVLQERSVLEAGAGEEAGQQPGAVLHPF
jgi:Flp pilus assembly CpaF family ATPase